jgi:hypothetical protein
VWSIVPSASAGEQQVPQVRLGSALREPDARSVDAENLGQFRSNRFAGSVAAVPLRRRRHRKGPLERAPVAHPDRLAVEGGGDLGQPVDRRARGLHEEDDSQDQHLADRDDGDQQRHHLDGDGRAELPARPRDHRRVTAAPNL